MQIYYGSTNVQSVALSPNYESDNTVFAGTGSGVYESTNGGQSWMQINNGLTNTLVISVALSPNYAIDNTVFAGTYGEGVFSYTFNHPPVANTGGPYSIYEGYPLTLDASASSDPDEPYGDVLSYAWDLNNDSFFDIFTETSTLSWPELAGYGITSPGTYPVALRVTDIFGETDRDTKTLTVNPLITNGSFEIDDDLNSIPDSWTPTNFAPGDGRSPDYAKEGSYSLKITSTGKLKKVTQTIQLSGSAGDKFTLSGWNKNVGTTSGGLCIRAYIYLNNTDGTRTSASIAFDRRQHDWKIGSANITANKAFNSIDILIANVNQTGITYFDDFRLVKQ